MRSLIDDFGLAEKYDSWENIRFGVFTLPEGTHRDLVTTQLLQSQKVSGVVPVYIDQDGNERYVDPELFTVQFKANISESQARDLISGWGSAIFKKQWTPGYYTITIPSGFTLFEAVRDVMELPEVKFTEPVFYGFNDLLEDTYLDDSWHLKNTGQRTGYTVGSDINAFPAWDITSGDPDVIIVIIDTGIDYNELPAAHPDLAANLLPRGNEDWDFLDDVNKLPNDESVQGHGTGVAGIACGVQNSIGIRGVAYSCRFMPLKALATGMNQPRADAINYAVSRQSEFDGMVINCSWQATGTITAITSAISDAVNNNVPVFAGSGNIGSSSVVYPASMNETIAVGALAPCDNLRKNSSTCDTELEPPQWTGWASNYGPKLDIIAPGVLLYATDRRGLVGNNYGQSNDLTDRDYTKLQWGTSFATPMVAATGALMLSVNNNLSPEDIRTILHETAVEVPAMGGDNFHNEYGYGRLDTFEALKYTLENYGGVFSGDGTLTGAWEFQENIEVAAGASLTIEAGTTLEFASGVNLIVNGTLTADGSQQTITFTRSGASGNWGNIRFNSGSTGTIKNAVIEYATKAIYSLSDNVTIEDCTIEHFTEQGIYASYSDMTIEDCLIRNPDGASHGIYLQYSNPTITETKVYGISGIGVYDYFGNTGTFSDGRIEDCSTGLKTFYSSIEVYNNYFEDNTYGVRFATNSDYVDIHDNDFIYNDYGIYVEQSDPNEVKWNQFGYSGTWKGNTYAGILVNFSYGSGNNYLDAKYNNFYDGDLYGKDIINNTGTTINATGNYWLTEWTTGPVNTSSPQGSANTNAGPGGSLGKTSGQEIAATELTLPGQFSLEQNYPNPFNPSTIITFHLPQEAKVNLVIYDVLGRTVRSLAANSFYQPGIHQVNWDGRNDAGNALASGVYFYGLEAVPVSGGNSYSQSRKLVFIQ